MWVRFHALLENPISIFPPVYTLVLVDICEDTTGLGKLPAEIFRALS